MQTTHISFPATDSVVLPGLLYEPDTKTQSILIWLHGMGDSGVFYKPERITSLADSLTKRGVALLAFNNRGAHNSKQLYKDDPSLSPAKQRYQGGTHYEKIADCLFDIDGAAAFVASQDFTNLFLAGHSTGANKICVYNSLAKANKFQKFVLAGPGDDLGLNYLHLGPKKYKQTLEYAKAAIANGSPTKTMPIYSGMHPFSAQSTVDLLQPNGLYNTFSYFEETNAQLGTKKLFNEYSSISKPLLVVIGSDDGSVATAGGSAEALKILKHHTNIRIVDESDFKIIADTDHNFSGKANEFAELIADWVCHG